MKIKAYETKEVSVRWFQTKNDRYRTQISLLKRKPVNVLNNLQFESAYKTVNTIHRGLYSHSTYAVGIQSNRKDIHMTMLLILLFITKLKGLNFSIEISDVSI